MKKINLKFLFFLFIILGLGFFAKTARASDVLDFSYTPDGWYYAGCNFNNGYSQVNLTENNSTYVAGHNNISKIRFRSTNFGSYSEGLRSVNLLITEAYTNEVVMATTTIEFGYWHDGYNDWVLPSPVPVLAGHQYNIFVSQAGDCDTVSCFNAACYFPPYYSYWLQIYYSDTYVPGPNFQINLINPNPIPNFTNYTTIPGTYVITYENPLNWYPQIKFMVRRLSDWYSGAWPDFLPSANILTSPMASSTLITASSTFQLPDGTYDMQVYFYGRQPNSLFKATTTFSVHTSSGYNGSGGYSFSTNTPDVLIKPPTTNYEHICDGIELSTGITELHIFGDIECGMKRALYAIVDYAFSPSYDTLTNFKTSYALWQGCFPFNGYFGITNAILDAASSTASTTAGTIKIPFIHSIAGGHTFYMMDFISSSTLSNWIGISNYNLFRTTLEYFMWLIAAATIFFTIKYI
jgi:hypothetical protein